MNQNRKYRPIMIVGTGSHVGKSVLAAGFCRIFRNRGLDVAPFKAQNMALNSGITPEGLEMGRAQINQAEAAGLEPHVDMNPILLKPTSDVGSQVILEGRVLGNYKGSAYYELKPKLVKKVMAAFNRLRERHQLLILEGAGSCAEMNLKKQDLVNMSMAKRAKAKVLLCADIDTGGVFAQVMGSISLLPPSERKLIAGVIINKFRGDPELFQDGIDFLEKKTGKPVLGVLPMFTDISLPQEDGVALERGRMGSAQEPSSFNGRRIRVGVVRLSHISNYTDIDALAADQAVDLIWVERPDQLAGLDLLILPGTKNTLVALAGLKKSDLFEAIRSFYSIGGRILGLCGGYQLLGRTIADPLGVEGPPSESEGLGLLEIATVMAGEKTTTRAEAECLEGLPFAVLGVVRGYEIHMGKTEPLDLNRPGLVLKKRGNRIIDLPEGQISANGRAVGTYLHGILDNDALRHAVLGWALPGARTGSYDYAAFKDRQYDLLAQLMEKHLNLDGLLEEEKQP